MRGMGYQGSIRELVLDEGVLDGGAEAPMVPEGLSDPAVAWPELEVVAASFCDRVVCHRMDDHDQLLVLLMSRGQFYERDADGEEQPRRLDGEALERHLSCLAPDEQLEAVPWSTPLTNGRGMAGRLLALASDPIFARLARSSQVIAEYGAADHVDESAPIAGVIQHERKGVTKAIMQAVSAYAGGQGAAAAMGLALGLWSPWTSITDVAQSYGCSTQVMRDAVDVLTYPEGFVRLVDFIGLDGARDYLNSFLALRRRESWHIEQASLTELLDGLGHLGVSMKASSFVDYAVRQRESQGAGIFDAAHWLDLWGDTLAMQSLVHGRVDDKYPQNLLEAHDRLILEAQRVRHAITDDEARLPQAPVDRFEAHRLELDQHSYEGGGYLIRPPRDVGEMLDEARRQGNCLATYVAAFKHAATDIYLMRAQGAPDVPLVTVEVRDGRVRQAFRAHNRAITHDQRAWLDRWCAREGIRAYDDHRALTVGLNIRDDDGPGERRRVDPMALAAARDRRTNRPGLWSHANEADVR